MHTLAAIVALAVSLSAPTLAVPVSPPPVLKRIPIGATPTDAWRIPVIILPGRFGGDQQQQRRDIEELDMRELSFEARSSTTPSDAPTVPVFIGISHFDDDQQQQKRDLEERYTRERFVPVVRSPPPVLKRIPINTTPTDAGRIPVYIPLPHLDDGEQQQKRDLEERYTREFFAPVAGTLSEFD